MSYGVFAKHYDLLTKNVNYAGYAERVDFILSCLGKKGGTIIDAACGTASLGAKLYNLGYKIIGVDSSESMIFEAEKKRALLGIEDKSFRLSVSDIRELSLSSPAEAAVCSLDALNHLGGISDVGRAFLSVKNSLKRGGVFIFDMNTPYKHKSVLGYNTFVYDLPEVYTVWRNEYFESGCTVAITLDFFVNEGGSYKKYTEKFSERAYKKERVTALLDRCGFEVLGLYDELKSAAPGPRTERILYVARRK